MVDIFDIEKEDIVSAFRTGKKNEESPRFVVLRFVNKEKRDDILKKSAKKEGSIKIRPDLSPEERQAEKAFFDGLKEAQKDAEEGAVFRVRGPPGARWFERSHKNKNT